MMNHGIRVSFFIFYFFELVRLIYASTPCLPTQAYPFFILFGLGLALAGIQLMNRPRLSHYADLWQIGYAYGTAATFYFWGSLRGSTIGALKGALGLTGSPKGLLPASSLNEITCSATHWSLSSFIRTESRPAAFSLLILALLSAGIKGHRLIKNKRAPSRSLNEEGAP